MRKRFGLPKFSERAALSLSKKFKPLDRAVQGCRGGMEMSPPSLLQRGWVARSRDTGSRDTGCRRLHSVPDDRVIQRMTVSFKRMASTAKDLLPEIFPIEVHSRPLRPCSFRANREPIEPYPAVSASPTKYL